MIFIARLLVESRSFGSAEVVSDVENFSVFGSFGVRIIRSSAATRRMEDVVESIKDASHLYEVERRALHAERPGFRISELQIGPTQSVPWHFHSAIQDTFYVIEGTIRIFLRDPQEEVRLGRGETYTVRARRPHLVTNGGESSATFLVLQGIGEYDYVPLV
jgi:mannose-6-phosphate isomerase-like protein (cupin superfamily)